MQLSAALKSAWAKPVLHLFCLLPLLALLWAAFNDGLGANPIEKLTRESGQWALRLLLVTLAVTPLRQWSGQAAVTRFRRMLGLYSFFYAGCHFSIWFLFDHALDIDDMFEDVLKRPYITLGFGALLVLLPLALTSNRAMILRLGRSWKTLHQLAYLALLLGVLHLVWQVRADYLEAGIYAIIAVILLLHRIGPIRRLGSKSPPATR